MSYWPFKTLEYNFISQMFDDYHEGLFILDREARFVYYNKHMCQMDGYTQEEVLGRYFTDIYNLNEQTSVSLTCLATQKPVKKCLYYRARNGMVINACCNTYPIFEDGQLAGALCFTLDFNLASIYLEELTCTYLTESNGQALPIASQSEAPHSFGHLVGQSESFVKAVEKAREAARHNMAIMLVGETGTGKELFAQAIHNHKPGRGRRFIAVNCPAIPENLLESLLFGTTKGSFTGAIDKAGIFEAANGGTVFLDEINSMSLDLQSKLLRVLQEKRVSRVGSTKEVQVDCQVISATSHNPYAEITAQRLRRDLFYRLGAILVYIPPLRDREGDIRILAEHFVKKHQHILKSRTKGLSPEALEWLERKVWLGNVRELEHAVASAMVFAKNETYLKTENFNTLDSFLEPGPAAKEKPRPDHREEAPASSAPQAPAEEQEQWEALLKNRPTKAELEQQEKEMIMKALEKTDGHKAAAAVILGFSPQLLNSKMKKYSLKYEIPDAAEEKDLIRQTLEKTKGHKSAAAALLGMSRQLLYSKMKKYGF